MGSSEHSSIGGAAATGGESFRADVASLIALHMLAQRTLPEGLSSGGVPTRLALETASHVDDIEVEATGQCRTWLQAKHRLDLSAKGDSPLGKAVLQLVRQHLSMTLDPDHHRLVVVCAEASQHLTTVVRVIRRFHFDSSVSREDVLRTDEERAHFENFEKLLGACWAAAGGTAPSWEDSSTFLRLMDLWLVPESPGGRVLGTAHGFLHNLLEDPSDATQFLEVLRSFMTTLAKSQRSADVIGLRRALRQLGVRFRNEGDSSSLVERHLESIVERWAKLPPFGALGDHMSLASSVRTSAVYISPPLKTIRAGNDSDIDAPTVVARLVRGDSIAVLGDVGAGKSTFVEWCASEIAQRCQRDSDSPVPQLVDANELTTGVLPRHASTQRPIVLLVDKVDEVGTSIWSSLARLRKQNPAVMSILAASRPTTPPSAQDGFSAVYLAAWSPADIQFLLEGWERCDRSAVSRVKIEANAPAFLELLSKPLTATAALVLSSQDKPLPKTRTGLIAAIGEFFFDIWRSQRSSPALDWEVVRPPLADLAVASLRGERLTFEKVAAAFASVRGFTLKLHQETERELGVLVRRDDGTFEFALRALAEYLAADFLSSQPNSELLFDQAAASSWGHEVARHMTSIAFAGGDPEQANKLLQRLGDAAQESLTRPASLRTFLAAIDTARDSANDDSWLLAETVESLGNAIVALLCDETSIWVGDVVAGKVRELAAVGGRVWNYVLSELVARIGSSTSDPEAWYANASLSVEQWIETLAHREPGVRSRAVTALAPHVDAPGVREALLLAAFDEAYDFGNPPPAVRAGVALRALARTPETAGIVSLLRNAVAQTGQITPGAAACALHPHEAPVDDIARSLYWLSTGCDVPRRVVEELLAAPGGPEALAKHEWPGWANKLVDELPNRRWATVAPSEYPPPSPSVRVRVARACGPALGLLSSEKRAQLCARVPHVVASELIAHGHLELAMSLRPDDIPLQHQRELGVLVLNSEPARNALLERWSARSKSDAARHELYPGIALEPLIEKGDDEAARIYAEWLPASPYMWGPFVHLASGAVLRHPHVLPVAREVALKVINQATVRAPDGTRLALSSAGTVLRNVAPAWSDDERLLADVWKLLESDPHEGLRAVLHATSELELPESRLEDLFRRVHTELEDACKSRTAEALFRAESEIDWLEDRAFITRAERLLRQLATLRHPIGWRASAVLWPLLSVDERRTHSTVIADDAVDASFVELPSDYLRRIVEADPDVWASSIIEAAEVGALIEGTVGFDALSHLPSGSQLAVARRLATTQLASMELPWRHRGEVGEYARPSDVVSRLLFDLNADSE